MTERQNGVNEESDDDYEDRQTEGKRIRRTGERIKYMKTERRKVKERFSRGRKSGG